MLILESRPRPAWLGIYLGIVLLNNILLAPILLLAPARYRGNGAGWPEALKSTAAAGILAVGAWAVVLTALSPFDESFRPDHFVQYTLWFREFVAPDLTPASLYVWKSAITGLFVNSVVSNQPDPTLPQEALLLTLRSSYLGAMAILLYAGVALIAAVRAIHAAKGQGLQNALVKQEPAVFSFIMLLITAFTFYPGAILYSTVVTPLIAAFLCRNLDLRLQREAWLLYAMLLVMVVNNADQVLKFRAALSLMAAQ
jgi:hypothetical protein